MVKNKIHANIRTKVPSEDLWVMLISTIRYSVRRDSYMPALCWDLIKSYGKSLRREQLLQISDEILIEIKLNRVPQEKTWKENAELAKQMAKAL